MTGQITRRRFLMISAAAAMLPSGAPGAGPVHRWRGSALGAEASLTFSGVGRGRAARLARAVEAEISRLEDIFSLYRPGSALSRLNREGGLGSPPAELLSVLSLADAVHGATGGAFDPTVQPLWQAHAEAAADGRVATRAAIAAARQRTGWRHVSADAAAIRFARPGMALTLNGIAQGAIADRIGDMLKAEGLTDVLVDTGEIAARGRRPDGSAWRAGIAAPDGTILNRISLSDRALATTSPGGTLLDPAGRVGHILDPRSGMARTRWRTVAVTAPRAGLADALSTGFALMTRAGIGRALDRFPGTTLETLV